MLADPARASPPSWQSRFALNATNFFVADMTAVMLPFLSTFLKERNWRYDAIGVATAISGLGVFVMQTPAGFIVDEVRRRRLLLAVTSLIVGLSYAAIPLLPGARPLPTYALLFAAGAASAFFVPLLGALALGLVGRAALGRTMGTNQGWNHAGNIAAALVAAIVVGLSIDLIFFTVAAVSLLAAASVFAIRRRDLDVVTGASVARAPALDTVCRALRLLSKRRGVVMLFVATALFHLANAPVMPLVALQVKTVGGTDHQVALVVLVAQVVMIPVALITGWACDRWGRKPTFALGFLVLPLRIFLYSLAGSPRALLALQALDGVGAGIYGVAIVAVCADLTAGSGAFNALMGLIATALAVGGVIGPLVSGVLIQHLGFAIAYDALAVVALIAAVVFLFGVPETRDRRVVHT